VLDVACDTGVVARLAAERVGPGGTVAALDLNPAMVSVARSIPSTGAVVRCVKTGRGVEEALSAQPWNCRAEQLSAVACAPASRERGYDDFNFER